RLWRPGRMAEPSRVARPAGGGVHVLRLGRESDAAAHRDECDLPPVVKGDGGTSGEGPGQPADGARPALPPAGGGGAGPGAGGGRGGAGRARARAATGLGAERRGGPWVKPYQPPGLWKELTGTDEYVPDHGESLYRRSLYTFWKRTVAPPALVTFDAAGRETCVVRPSRTNTPLQALSLMNDVTFVEASRVLAQRAMREGGASPEGRGTLAFRLAPARKPRPAELRVLLDGYREHLADYRKDEKAARKLTGIGEAPRDERLDVAELAAYTAVAGVILNLDEVVTKE